MKTARRSLLTAVTVLVAAGTLAACGGGGATTEATTEVATETPSATATVTQQPTPTETAPETEAGGQTVSFFDIKPGDCLNMSDVEQGIEATLIDCAASHDAEVFAETTMADAAFPGADAAKAQAETFCVQEFQTYVGLDYQSSKYEIYYFTPTQDTWDTMNDRLISCIVYDAAPYNGTLQGSNQ